MLFQMQVNLQNKSIGGNEFNLNVILTQIPPQLYRVITAWNTVAYQSACRKQRPLEHLKPGSVLMVCTRIRV